MYVYILYILYDTHRSIIVYMYYSFDTCIIYNVGVDLIM